jgi:tRNA A37 N6-isopentenylltransferase MiaA
VIRRHLVITGPTGVGKTALVNELLAELPIEVINMDSIQVYAFFRVGPGREDMTCRERRHLYGYLSPHDVLDRATYVRCASSVAHEIAHRGMVPVFEGGSRSLLPALRTELPLDIVGLRPPVDRAWRAARLRRRVDGYFAQGALVEEIEAGLRAGYGETRLMRDPLVYMQARDHMAGRMTLEECKRAMVQSMLEMQDDQMAVFARMDVTWVDLASETPRAFSRRIGERLAAAGWLQRDATRGAG